MSVLNSDAGDFSVPMGNGLNLSPCGGGLFSVTGHSENKVCRLVNKDKVRILVVEDNELWGDTVNTAARMSRYGEPGVVVMTAATSSLIQGRFKLNRLGTFEVKGKGMVELVTCC